MKFTCSVDPADTLTFYSENRQIVLNNGQRQGSIFLSPEDTAALAKALGPPANTEYTCDTLPEDILTVSSGPEHVSLRTEDKDDVLSVDLRKEQVVALVQDLQERLASL